MENEIIWEDRTGRRRTLAHYGYSPDDCMTDETMLERLKDFPEALRLIAPAQEIRALFDPDYPQALIQLNWKRKDEFSCTKD